MLVLNLKVSIEKVRIIKSSVIYTVALKGRKNLNTFLKIINITVDSAIVTVGSMLAQQSNRCFCNH